MKYKKISLAIALILGLMNVSSSTARSFGPQSSESQRRAQTTRPSDAEIIQSAREALLELKFCREQEAIAKKKVEEQAAIIGAQAEQIKKYEASIAKYEAAVTARTQAEVLVAEIRTNYEKQLAIAEKQLAIEQGKTRFWKTMTSIGVVTAAIVGAAVVYALKD